MQMLAGTAWQLLANHSTQLEPLRLAKSNMTGRSSFTSARIREATLGETHAMTAGTICSMGASYGEKGQFDRAIAEAERSLCICREVLGPYHPQTLQKQQNFTNIRSAAAAARSGRGQR